MSHPLTEPVQLTELKGWLRAKKGRSSFDSLARKTIKAELPVSACTLRRALDGRLPTKHTVLAFARAASADELTAERLWEAAAGATRQQSAKPHAHASYVPGWITTRAGLTKAMQRIRTAANNPTLRALAAAPEAAGRLSRSTLHLALTGQRLPSKQLLAAFAAACHATTRTTEALLAAHARILTGPALPYPCAIAEAAEERRQRDAAARPWLTEPELDWYDQQQHDEAATRRRLLDELTDDQIEIWEQWEPPQTQPLSPGPPSELATRSVPAPGGGAGEEAGWCWTPPQHTHQPGPARGELAC
jgi:hypothetical protein